MQQNKLVIFWISKKTYNLQIQAALEGNNYF